MSVIDWRAARITVTVLLVCAAILAVVVMREALTIMVLAVLLAYVLSPLVDLVDRYSGGRRASRTLSLAVVYLAMITIVSLAAGWVFSQAAEEAAVLLRTLPSYLRDPALFDKLPVPAWMRGAQTQIVEWVRTEVDAQTANLGPMLARAGRGVVWVVGSAVYLVLVPILSFFLLKDGHSIRQIVIEQFNSKESQNTAEGVLADIHLVLANYMRAILLQCLSSFVMFVLMLHILGVPYALLLSVIIGVLEIVPVAGPLISATTTLLVAGFAGYHQMLWLVLLLIIARLVLDYVIQPYIMGQGVELPPLAIIFGVLAGEALGGILGIFLSIPVMAILRMLYVRYRGRRTGAIVSAAV